MANGSETRGYSLLCPECQGRTHVKDSRGVESTNEIWRKRQCEKGHVFSTRERVTDDKKCPV